MANPLSTLSAGAAQSSRPGNRARRGLLWLAAILLAYLVYAFVFPDSWTRQLHAATRNADRIRVRSGGTCHRKPEIERTLFEVTDAGKVRAILASIQVRRSLSWMGCQCCGEPTIEVYQGAQLVANLGVHHGERLRWPGAWSCDAVLTADAAQALVNFLVENGVDAP